MKKTLAILLSFVMVISFAACGSTTDTTENTTTENTKAENTKAENETEEEVAADTALSGKVDIWSWGSGDEAKARQDIVTAFADEHPELDVVCTIFPSADSVWDQKSAAALSSGSAGDVMMMCANHYGMNAKYFDDLNPYVEKDGINLDDVIVDGMLDGYYLTNGKLHALPLMGYCFLMAYNKDMFAEFGVEEPKDGWTLQDLAGWGKAFATGEGIDQTFALTKSWIWNNVMIYSCGGKPYTDDKSQTLMNTPEIVEGLKLYKELTDEGILTNDVALQATPEQTLFLSNKIAMYPLGLYEAAAVCDQATEVGMNMGITMMPSDINGNEINFICDQGYAITKDAGNKDAAWQFIKEASFENEEMAKITATTGIPACKSVAEGFFNEVEYSCPDLKNSMFVEHMSTSTLWPFGGTLNSAADIWSTMVSAVLTDDQDPQAVVDEYAPLLEKEFNGYVFEY